MATTIMTVPDYTNKALETTNVDGSIADVLLDHLVPDVAALGAGIAVPAVDATDNVDVCDVVGRKDDTANSTVGDTSSIMRYVKGILNQLAALTTSVSDASTTTAGVIVQDGATGTPDIIKVTSSATANTFGANAAIDAAVSADSWISHVTVAFAGATMASPSLIKACIEIQTGASPATKIRFSIGYCNVGTPATQWQDPIVFALPVPIKVASGTAISAQASTDQADAMDFYVGLSMYQGLE